MAEAHSVIVCAEGYRVHGADWRRDPRGFPPVAASALAYAETLTDRQVANARSVVADAKAAWRDAIAENEILVQPTLPMPPAPRHAEVAMIGAERHPITNANIRFCIMANVAGLPVVVAPVAGLSVQFTGASRRDEWLLATVRRILGEA
jgi:Asp-tRNA(Asn)/Glu-tRNA(Gln) amidotransferase A subunit family amidase